MDWMYNSTFDPYSKIEIIAFVSPWTQVLGLLQIFLSLHFSVGHGLVSSHPYWLFELFLLIDWCVERHLLFRIIWSKCLIIKRNVSNKFLDSIISLRIIFASFLILDRFHNFRRWLAILVWGIWDVFDFWVLRSVGLYDGFRSFLDGCNWISGVYWLVLHYLFSVFELRLFNQRGWNFVHWVLLCIDIH